VSVCHDACPSGCYGDSEREVQANCVRRSLGMVQRYQKRISGPLMDCLAGEGERALSSLPLVFPPLLPSSCVLCEILSRYCVQRSHYRVSLHLAGCLDLRNTPIV
jgi:hypothetical protein